MYPKKATLIWTSEKGQSCLVFTILLMCGTNLLLKTYYSNQLRMNVCVHVCVGVCVSVSVCVCVCVFVCVRAWVLASLLQKSCSLAITRVGSAWL